MTTPRAALLWTGILAGPMAFAGDLTTRYALVKWSCTTGQTSVLTLVTAAALAIAACGAAAAGRAWLQTPRDAQASGGRPFDRARFMAVCGLLSSGLFALVMIATASPQWVLDACR